jgi:hypothetical protein
MSSDGVKPETQLCRFDSALDTLIVNLPYQEYKIHLAQLKLDVFSSQKEITA